MEKSLPLLKASELVAVVNQSLEYAYSSVLVEGEVESFKVNQNKFVFFNLKDEDVSISCFMMVFQLRLPLEDGMRVVVRARPKVTKWSKFSLTIDAIQPKGEGTIKKNFEKLRTQLDAEGLFDESRKRLLPLRPTRVGVIASTESAGYADFMRISAERWGGVDFLVYHTMVQGIDAADQMIAGLRYFNAQAEPPEVIVLIRGGGSADDLAAYNDEQLVREIAASRVPTLVGVGHEIDTTLSDLAADVRAATPSHAAEQLVPDKADVKRQVRYQVSQLETRTLRLLDERTEYVKRRVQETAMALERRFDEYKARLDYLQRIISVYNPNEVLKKGYAIVHGVPHVGQDIMIEADTYKVIAEVKKYEAK